MAARRQASAVHEEAYQVHGMPGGTWLLDNGSRLNLEYRDDGVFASISPAPPKEEFLVSLSRLGFKGESMLTALGARGRTTVAMRGKGDAAWELAGADADFLRVDFVDATLIWQRANYSVNGESELTVLADAWPSATRYLRSMGASLPLLTKLAVDLS